MNQQQAEQFVADHAANLGMTPQDAVSAFGDISRPSENINWSTVADAACVLLNAWHADDQRTTIADACPRCDGFFPKHAETCPHCDYPD